MKGTIDLTKLRTPEVKAAEVVTKAKTKRDALLNDFDTKLYRNPFYWDDLTSDQQKARTDYRKALKDITKLDGYPDAIVWPTIPE